MHKKGSVLMDNNGISDMSHLLSVEVEGFKFAVELGKDAVKFLQRLAAIFSNALKWGMIDKSWRYYKEAGATNIANFRAKHPEGFEALTINKKDYGAFLKFAKKYNLTFVKVPCANKNSVAVWYGKNDVQLINHFTNMRKQKLEKEQAKKGMEDPVLERVEGEVVYEPPRVKDLSDYMYDNGYMDCSRKEFDDILLETYGEQCTTLTQFMEKSRDGVNPDAQKKINTEIAERCRKEDLSKEARAGALVVTFEKKRYAGFDRQNQIVFFQMVRKPPRWMGVPADRLIKTKENNFTAVLNDQSKTMLYDIKFSKSAPNGFSFTPQEQLNTDRVKELAKVFDKDVIDLREYTDKVTENIVIMERRFDSDPDNMYTDMNISSFENQMDRLDSAMYYQMEKKGVSELQTEKLREQAIDAAASNAARIRAGRKR